MVELLLAGISATASLGQLLFALRSRERPRRPTEKELASRRERAETPLTRGRVALSRCVQEQQTLDHLQRRIQESFERFATQSESVPLSEMGALYEQLRDEICVVLTTIRTSCGGRLPTKRLQDLAGQFEC